MDSDAASDEKASKTRLTRWWEKPGTVRREGRQGRLVSPVGRGTFVSCPECDQNPVVYNGNYFCDGWVFPGPARAEEGECEWALAHPVRNRRDRAFCDLVGLDYH